MPQTPVCCHQDNQNFFKSKLFLVSAIALLLVFLSYVFALLIFPGFSLDPKSGNIFMESNKYLHNLIQMPLVLLIFVAGVVFVLLGIALPLFTFPKNASCGIWYAGPGTILTVFALFLLAGFNNTAYYPSTFDLQSSLTIHNSSSSHYTLTVMSYVSLLVPFVIAYIWYAWKAINNKKIEP